MDGQRFDALTKAWGSGASRRRVLGGLLGGAAALALRRVGGTPDENQVPPQIGTVCPPEATPCVAVANRGPDQRSLGLNCCPPGMVCYKCSGGTIEREPGREGEFSISTTVGAICCTPGVDCPGDANERHTWCRPNH